jgi:PKD repeat protein
VAGTAPLTVTFSDLSSGEPAAWAWDFGDGGSSTEQHPSHPYLASGSYTVSLTVSNDLGSHSLTKFSYILVEEPTVPTAHFSASPLEGTAPLTVTFSDHSGGYPTSWSWDFGDGDTTPVQNPVHTYHQTGSFTVSLTVSNAQGTDTLTRSNYITVTQAPPVANFWASPVAGTVPLTVTFVDLSTNGPTAWLWNFGDGGTSTEPNPAHTYQQTGPFTVTLTVSNTFGSDTMVDINCITVSEAGQNIYLPLILKNE